LVQAMHIKIPSWPMSTPYKWAKTCLHQCHKRTRAKMHEKKGTQKDAEEKKRKRGSIKKRKSGDDVKRNIVVERKRKGDKGVQCGTERMNQLAQKTMTMTMGRRKGKGDPRDGTDMVMGTLVEKTNSTVWKVEEKKGKDTIGDVIAIAIQEMNERQENEATITGDEELWIQ
jgi:hypothetical protein